jgi:hypothetical protein
MFASLFAFALWGNLPVASVAEGPIWLKDYALARKHGAAANKPLIVVIGSGQRGWEKLNHEGAWSKEVEQLLANHYVCLYVDTDEEGGKKLASAFEVNDLGLVISSRNCDVQAFRHEGRLNNGDLEWYLRRYADPDRVARFTESELAFRYSYYVQPAPVTTVPVGGTVPVCQA